MLTPGCDVTLCLKSTCTSCQLFDDLIDMVTNLGGKWPSEVLVHGAHEPGLV
jgi:hypothetical protein